MGSETQSVLDSKKVLWTGRIISGLLVLMLLASGVMKFIQPPGFPQEFAKLGWDVKFALGLGIVEILCALLYALPRTAVFGAILLTGYFGGAIATHVRIDDSFFVPLLLGVLTWGGLFLREPRLRAILPIRE